MFVRLNETKQEKLFIKLHRSHLSDVDRTSWADVMSLLVIFFVALCIALVSLPSFSPSTFSQFSSSPSLPCVLSVGAIRPDCASLHSDGHNSIISFPAILSTICCFFSFSFYFLLFLSLFLYVWDVVEPASLEENCNGIISNYNLSLIKVNNGNQLIIFTNLWKSSLLSNRLKLSFVYLNAFLETISNTQKINKWNYKQSL